MASKEGGVVREGAMALHSVERRIDDPAATGEDLRVLFLLVAAVLATGPGGHKVRRDGEVDDGWGQLRKSRKRADSHPMSPPVMMTRPSTPMVSKK